MATNGKIDLSNLEATYHIDDINLVNYKDIQSSDEFRLTGEIFSNIFFAFFGSLLTSYNSTYTVVAVVFLAISIISYTRYIQKAKSIKNTEDLKRMSSSYYQNNFYNHLLFSNYLKSYKKGDDEKRGNVGS